jgi:23S rRNA pseudouridine1911/1915/1917 synthase
MGLESRLVFEDEHCLAVVKPAGQFSQGSWAPPGEQTLEQEVREYLNAADPSAVYLGIVHRLDRPVSGILIWAKTAKSARRISQQFEKRIVEKEYWGIVQDVREKAHPEREGAGLIAGAAGDGIWIDWLTSAGVAGVVRAVAAGSEPARQAITRFCVAKASSLAPGLLWLRLWPETGRTHQLRVQAARRGLPILGDTNYGAFRPFPHGIALHARLLRLRHPILGTPLELTAPLPATWAEQGIVLPDSAVSSGNSMNQARKHLEA